MVFLGGSSLLEESKGSVRLRQALHRCNTHRPLEQPFEPARRLDHLLLAFSSIGQANVRAGR